MLDIAKEEQALRAIANPLDRESAARQAAEQARGVMEGASRVRAEAIKEVYDVFGGTKTSRLFGINRVSLYRIIEPVRTDEEKQARAAKWVMAAELLLTVATSTPGTSEEPGGNEDHGDHYREIEGG